MITFSGSVLTSDMIDKWLSMQCWAGCIRLVVFVDAGSFSLKQTVFKGDMADSREPPLSSTCVN